MPEFQFSFSSSSISDEDSFKLLELPVDLCKIIESSLATAKPLRFDIKGDAAEEAVLCTDDRTYALRSVALSNTIVVATSPQYSSNLDFADDTLVIRDQVNEILELTPIVPRLHKLTTLLRGKEYGEDHEDEEMEDDTEQRLSYSDAKNTIQASTVELERGLRDKRILDVNGELRPIAPAYLSHIIELILNSLVSNAIDHTAASVENLCTILSENHEVPRLISTQVMSWFGNIQDGHWRMDVQSVIREAGLSVLKSHQTSPISLQKLTAAWKALVGDKFASEVSLQLLAGNYLMNTSYDGLDMLTYFPASTLPIEPAPRFSDLFLTRSRWKSEDIAPFLSDIAVDSKERDKLLLKYARATTSSDGVWYTSRTQFNG
ncbi:Ctf8p and Ctf18p associating protein [Marasmius crinis-equi]|uniref:Ctf8p and Ctf18p associating protein n=1 Tax=Marasmius crinis-equi TaxID=585013 RepID=A0ABR3FNC0_9AGAR